ncbi:MAG: phage portal protein [Candidatus Roizmanbacteria bacterium]|nr:phage portal protein [Candidatus Roizmanbacteria bacterium]
MNGNIIGTDTDTGIANQATSVYGASWNALHTPAYDSASMDFKNSQREAYVADADLLAINELLLIQSRSRNVSRNNPIVTSAEDKYVAKLGSIKVNFKNPDGTEHKLMQELWDEFADDPNLDGKGNLCTNQAVWNHDRFQSGEAIIRMIIKQKDNSNRIPLKLQSIESEYLDVTYMGFSDPELSQLPFGTTRYGITFDDYNKPIFYNFWSDRHYGIRNVNTTPWQHVKVPAEDVCHIFERRRSNQWRGTPVVSSLLSTIYEITDLTDATVAKQLAAAAISWIVEQPDGSPLNAPGSIRTAGNTMPTDLERKLFFVANGGQVQYTNPGEKFQLVQSSDIGNNLTSLLKHQLQTIAAGYGIPYYMLTGDTEGLNFSSIQGILLEFRNRLEYIHHYINLPDGLDRIVKRFTAIANIMYPETVTAKPSYQFPKNYGVDMLKDYQGNVLGMQSGQTTLKRVMDENHLTEEEVLQDQALKEKLGLVGLTDLPTSANMTQNNNTPQRDTTSN